MSTLVAKRVVLNQEPAVLTVLSECSMLEFERKTPRESGLSLVSQSFHVFRMKDSLSKIWCKHIVRSKARIVEGSSVGVDRHSGGIQDDYRLRYCIRDLPKLAFVLTQFILSLLKGFDISAYSVPHDDLASFVAEWLEANEEPTKDAIMAAHTRFDVTWFSGAQQLPPFFHE